MIVSVLAYGTVYYWTLGLFQLGALVVLVSWGFDAWRTGTLRISRNVLQVPLLALILIGLVQLLPLGGAGDQAPLGISVSKSLSLDPYATRLVLLQLWGLFVFFAAALVFIDSPKRLRRIVLVITIFGFLLGIFGLIQSFASPTAIYGLKQPAQSVPFGPFVNRHHFAGYMELTLALPLGLLLSGAVDREKTFLYIFAIVMMGIALIMTNSRGGIISLAAEAGFLFLVATPIRRRKSSTGDQSKQKIKGLAVRAGLALALLLVLFTGVVFLGGESVLTRFLGTVSAEDPTTGRAHFWSVTLQIIKANPVLGAGMGAYGVAYTPFDTRNGLLRVEQAHNDYLQLLSDGGIIAGLFGLFFLAALFRQAFARRGTEDKFRRGVAMGALGGCFAVLVHSFFDFTLHTTSNALLFLVLAALATLNGRVEEHIKRRRRRRRTET